MEDSKLEDGGELEGASNEVHVSLDVVSSSATANTSKFWDKERYVVELMPKVPAFVREKYNSDDYDPLVVSLGPYHHGHPRLQFAEELKPSILKAFVSRTEFDEQLLLNEALKVIQDLRDSYPQGSTNVYGDTVFARMMLQDAAFAVEYIRDQFGPANHHRWDIDLHSHLGRGVMEHVTRDLYVLENQIPFWFLTIMFHIRCGKRDGDKLLNNFLNWSSFRSIEVQDRLDSPAHLVVKVRAVVISGWSSFENGWFPSSENDFERLRRREKAILVSKIRSHAQVIRSAMLFQSAGAGDVPQIPQIPQVEGSSSITKIIHSFHSATELKAKGIHIRRSLTNSLRDVRFTSGFFFSTLHLPAALVTVRTRSMYSNIIACEMSPDSYHEEKYIVAAYVNFFKYLIESPKDVKELQDKGVIKNMLGSDEEVVKLYKDIYTFGIDCSKEYNDVIEKIQRHYNSRARTWLADLLYSYFHTPWTVIALLGSFLVIGLTITQTYYAIHPKGNN